METMTYIEVIQNSTLNDKVLTLPKVQLDRKLYQEVAKSLEGIGGKWNKKHNGFLFEVDPSELLEEIKSGVKRNLKQETQFFETPGRVADFMAQHLFYQSGQSVLEPSAGKGALIDAFIRENGDKGGIEFFYIEKDATRNSFLQKKYKERGYLHLHPAGDDFLNLQSTEKFDRILANPPFSKNQDIDHVLKMWEHLKPGGRLVSITSNHWSFSKNKKESDFRRFVEENDGETYDLESGAFKSSGTMVASQILILDKPKSLSKAKGQ